MTKRERLTSGTSQHIPPIACKAMENPYEIRNSEGTLICYVPLPIGAGAAFIVRAVNAHDALLAAVKASVLALTEGDPYSKVAALHFAKAAVAKAEGKPA